MLAIAIGATACTESVVTEQMQQEISFRPLTTSLTKATSINASTLNSYKVIARAQNASYSAFNFDAEFTKSGNAWSTPGKYFWPVDKAAVINFAAYAPTNFAASLAITPTISDNGTVISNIQPKRQASEQLDLLVAKKSQSRSGGTSVPLAFKHAFSQIIVKAQCDKPSMYSVEVIGVKLGNIINKATLTIPATSADDTQLTGAWGNRATTKTTYVSGGASKATEPLTLTANPQNIMMGGGSFMIIPQQGGGAWNGTASNTGSYIAVLCRIKQNNGAGGKTLLYPSDGSKFAYAAVGVGTNWLPGTTYTYTIKFFSNGGGAGLVPPEKGDPANPGHNWVDETPTTGNKVVGGALSFSLTTAAWTDAPDDLNPVAPQG